MPEVQTEPTAAPTADRVTATAVVDADAAVEPELVETDLLVEDVSIDGMCGVY